MFLKRPFSPQYNTIGCNSVQKKHVFIRFAFYFFRPSPGEIRQIYIEKSSEQLGITIEEGSGIVGSKKGVFVSSVSENSLASQVGLQVSFNINSK